MGDQILGPGNYILEFLNGETKTIFLGHIITNSVGNAVFLVGSDGTYYNMQTIISVKKEKK